jgi:hypothetical protein
MESLDLDILEIPKMICKFGQMLVKLLLSMHHKVCADKLRVRLTLSLIEDAQA